MNVSAPSKISTFRVLPEFEIVKKIDAPAKRMLSLWHSKCYEHYGALVPVVIAKSDDHPAGREKGVQDLNTATIHEQDGVAHLIVLLQETKNLSSVVFAHEVGHRVLDLMGFQSLTPNSEEFQVLSNLINSLASHPALHRFQASLGHDTQQMIDERASLQLQDFKTSVEAQSFKDVYNLRVALCLADDVLHASAPIQAELVETLQKFRYIGALVDRIVEAAKHYGLNEPDQALRFSRRLVKVLNLQPNEWRTSDRAANLRARLKALNQAGKMPDIAGKHRLPWDKLKALAVSRNPKLD